MDKKIKDKTIGIFGVALFLMTIILGKLSIHYQIYIGTKALTIITFLLIGFISLSLSMKYFNQLFGDK